MHIARREEDTVSSETLFISTILSRAFVWNRTRIWNCKLSLASEYYLKHFPFNSFLKNGSLQSAIYDFLKKKKGIRDVSRSIYHRKLT